MYEIFKSTDTPGAKLYRISEPVGALKKMKLPLHKGLVKIPLQIRMLERFGIDMDECPCCKNKTLKLVKIFYPRKNADDG